MSSHKPLIGIALIGLFYGTWSATAQTNTSPIEVEYGASQAYQSSWTTGNIPFQPQSWDQLSLINNDMTDPNNFVSIYFQSGNTNGEATGRIGLVQEGNYQSAFVFQTRTNASGSPQNEVMRVSGSGKVGIGTKAPNATLEVNGGAIVDTGLQVGNPSSGPSLQVGSNGITFAGVQGTQTTPWTGVLCGGDYAESVGVTGARKQYEPGDLIVVDPTRPGSFAKSSEPYSTLVAGIYSTKPGVTGKRSPASSAAPEIPMAMIGIVPAKVSAENGPIKPGDLLVTSSTVGYAMKGTDPSRMTGAVVGKALGSVPKGTGVIEVLVTLQ